MPAHEANLLEYPANQDAKALEITTRFLVHKWRWRVNDEQQVISICNESLNRAINKYDSQHVKKASFCTFYRMIAERLLFNAVRDRNSKNRIPATVSADTLFNLAQPETLSYEFFNKSDKDIEKQLDSMKYLTELERQILKETCISRLNRGQGAKKLKIRQAKFSLNLKSALEKISDPRKRNIKRQRKEATC